MKLVDNKFNITNKNAFGEQGDKGWSLNFQERVSHTYTLRLR